MVIHQAVLEAQQLGHVEVTPAHVVRVLVRTVEVVTRVAARELGVMLVLDHVAAEIAALPTAGYRGAAPTLSSAVEQALAKARPPGLLARWTKKPGLADLFDALLPLLPAAQLRFEPGPVLELWEGASAYKRKRKHRNVLIDHAVVWLLEHDARLRGAARRSGFEPMALRNGLAARMNVRYRSLKLNPKLVRAGVLLTNNAARRSLDRDLLVAQLLAYGPMKTALASLGVDAFALRFAYVHVDDTTTEIPIPPGDALDLVLLNDDFTPSAAIVALLVGVFGVTREVATRIAADVKAAGSSPVAAGVTRATAEEWVRAFAVARTERDLVLKLEVRGSIAR